MFGAGQMLQRSWDHSKGEVIDSSEGMSELFNEAFGKVFTKERLGGVLEAKWEFGDQQSIGISDIAIDEEAVMLRLDKLRDDKAAEADELIPRFLNKLKRNKLPHKQNIHNAVSQSHLIISFGPAAAWPCFVPVSYTHLTLPTNREV